MVELNFGDVSIDAADFEIDIDSEDISVPVKSDCSMSWDLDDEQLNFFKGLIVTIRKKNLCKCRDCKYFRLVFDDDLRLVDFVCDLGASREDMLESSHCLLLF